MNGMIRNLTTNKIQCNYFLPILLIERIFKTLKTKMFLSRDNIRAKMLTEISRQIVNSLTPMTNACFDTRYSPKALKTGVIKPFLIPTTKNMLDYRYCENYWKKTKIMTFSNKHGIISK